MSNRKLGFELGYIGLARDYSRSPPQNYYEEELKRIITNQETEIANKDAEIADLKTKVVDKDAEIAEKDVKIAELEDQLAVKDAEIAASKKDESNNFDSAGEQSIGLFREAATVRGEKYAECQRTLAEYQRALAEYQRTLSEDLIKAEEQVTAASAKAKANAKARKLADERARVAEERARTAEERAREAVKIALGEDTDEEEECCVCMERPATAQLAPCGHHTCMSCATRIRADGCPLCRGAITDISKT